MKETTETIVQNMQPYNSETLYKKIVETAQNDEKAKDWLRLLLYYVNLYTIQRDEKTATQLYSLMKLYHKSVLKTKEDCSFEKGSAGFLYVTIRLYELNIAKNFMEDAFSLLEENIENFIISPYTNNSVNTGRSGCLLVLEYYAAITNNTKTKKWVAQLTEKILSQAQATDKGVFWKDRVEKLHGLLNFEYGNAGIGYTFLKLSESAQNDEYVQLSEQIYAYQTQFWNDNAGWKATKKGIENIKVYQAALEAIQNENNTFFEPVFDLLFVHIGVTRFTLHLCQKTQDETLKVDLINYFAKCENLFENQKEKLSLKRAILLGTLFLEAARILQNEDFHAKAITTLNFIQEKLATQTIQIFSDAVLIAQLAHFKLAINNQIISNAVVPIYSVSNKKNTQETSQIQIKEKLVQNTFPRTFAYIKKHQKELLSNYLLQPIQDKLILNFMMCIKKNLNQFAPTQKKQLSEILKLEITCENLKKSIKNYAYLEAKNIYTYQTVQTLFNGTDEALKTYTLQLNPQAKKLTTAWNWELKNKQVSEENLALPEASWSVYVFPYYTKVLQEYWQHPHNVVLEYFKNQTEIETAITQLQQFYQSQDAIFIDNFSQFIMAESSYVLENLEAILLNIIKEYMAVGLLEIVENTPKSN